jgi:molecular chaperone GrpE
MNNDLPISYAGLPEPETVTRLRAGFQGIEQQFATLMMQFDTALLDMKDKLQRAEAELVNQRSRGRRETEDARMYAMQKFGRDVVEVAENLHRGINSMPAPSPDEPAYLTKLRDGFQGIERSFVALLERNGIDRQDPTGALFDANFHQAMAEQDAPDVPSGTILHAWSHTWTLNGRLLRPGMVIVAKGGPQPTLRVDRF